MLSYDWNFGRLQTYVGAFTSGVGVTIALSLATMLFATLLGVAWGIALSRGGLVAKLTTPISYILRACPPIVLVLFGYYFYTAQIIGYALDGFLVFVFSVGFNIAAFIADVTRSAISNTPEEFLDIGRATGMSDRQILRRIIAPNAIREAAAPVSYLFVETIKVTSLASVISVREAVYVAQSVIIDITRSLEVWVVVAAIYCLLVLPVMLIARRIERDVKRSAGIVAS